MNTITFSENKIEFSKNRNIFFDSKEANTNNLILINNESPWKPNLNNGALTDLQQIIFNTIRGQTPTSKELLKKDFLISVIWKKNPEFLKEARDLLKKILIDIFTQHERELKPGEKFHLEMIVGDILSLYPFLGPEENESISIPLLIEDQWKLIEYKIERLQLTPSEMGSPLVAFGLVPKQPDLFPPLLLFKGTTFPTDDGFFLSLLTDINPFLPVGNLGFRLGKKEIIQWLNKHVKKFKVRIYGKSLGGALAWQMALDKPEIVETVIAYGAPGFTSKYLKRCQELEKKQQLPKIHMFFQENDPIPHFDQKAKNGIDYYQVVGKQHFTGIPAHVHMYSTHEHSAIYKINSEKEFEKGYHYSAVLLKCIASLIIFPLMIMIFAIKLTTEQIIKTIKKHVKIIQSADLFKNEFFKRTFIS